MHEGLEVRDLVVQFAGRTVLDHVSLRVAHGETVAVLGPSGSGKSTLLKVIAGILTADAGSVHLDGDDITEVPAHRRRIGMVFQDQQLFPHLDVRHNIAFGLRMQRLPRRDVDARVGELLTLIGLEGFGGRRVDDLSGGEATRVALARSLAPRPRILLLDEPLTGLDRDLHDRLALELRRLLEDTTAVLVTHDPDEAAVIADRRLLVADLARTSHSDVRVEHVSATDTHALRLSVLRFDTPTKDVEFAEDEWPGVVHLGLRRAGELVATSTWVPRNYDGPLPSGTTVADRAVQLRGMATARHLQGHGLGGVLIEGGVAEMRAAGYTLVWARARDAALDFYARHGFEISGDGFIDAATQLPHHLIVRRLT